MGTMKLCLFLLLVAAVSPLSFAYSDWTHAYGAPEYAFWGSSTPTATIEDNRRLLFQYGFAYKYPRNRYLSYEALRKNNVPCGHRGRSYYDCNQHQKANPYRRGCTAITGCARFTD